VSIPHAPDRQRIEPGIREQSGPAGSSARNISACGNNRTAGSPAAAMARDLELVSNMDNLLSPETECYLLSIDERDFADVAAVLGLRARPASPNDQELVEAYLRDKDDFSQTQFPFLITTVPDILPQ